MFEPHIEILPEPQKLLWPELVIVPDHFVLYGGTALALRLGHRQSVDFDFFTSEDIEPAELLRDLEILQGGKILQNSRQTLTVAVNRGGIVKLSFFGGLKTLGRVGDVDQIPENQLNVASLLDIAGMKAAVITQRAEAKDYIDLLAITNNGVSLQEAMGAAQAIYGEQYNAMLTVKSLMSFVDGDLPKLTVSQKRQCEKLATTANLTQLPQIKRKSQNLRGDDAPGTNLTR
jgi:predicted nucleotidyltransferase component of viral defense system